MGGCSDEADPVFMSPLNMVLVGKTGNGKSATGNSILGEKKFISKRSYSGVTTNSSLNTTTLKNGQILNVIDTPGLFDPNVGNEFIGKEVVSCIDKAKDGMHAVLVVFSACNRFSDEEKAVISCLVTWFGSKIYEYMIVIFTGGDELEEDGKTLEEVLHTCPKSLKEILGLCGNRRVLFDNRTKNEIKKAKQVEELLFLVNMVLEKNDGEPYTNQVFMELKKLNIELAEQAKEFKAKHMTEQDAIGLIERIHDKQLNRIIKMFMSNFKETHIKLEKELKEERAARQKAEKNAMDKQKKTEDDIKKLKQELAAGKGWCVIM